jgi:hypothetical protein
MTRKKIEGAKRVWIDGVELANCRVCGYPPNVEKMADGGLKIGCHDAEPEPHKCVIESEPGTWAIQTWNALQIAGKDLEPIHVAGPGTPVVGHRQK